MIAGLCATVPTFAQFNPKRQATRLDPVMVPDTILNRAIQPTTELKFELYSDAYDKYLRKLRSKQRNSYTISPGLKVSQASFSNWQAGGDNNYAGIASLNVKHSYTAPVFSIVTIFDSKYGLLRTSGQTRKNLDYFNVTVTPSWNISERWKLSTDMIWETQFSKGYDYTADSRTWKSSFMAPGTIKISGGFTYESENKELKILLAPITGKMNFVLNDSLSRKGGLGIDPSSKNPKFKAEIGMSARINYSTKFAQEKMQYTTKFETFWGYKHMPISEWENTLNFKFTNIFSASIYTRLIYNDQLVTPKVAAVRDDPGRKIKPWRYIQLYESFGLELTFKINSKPSKPIEESTITKTRLRYKR